MTRITFQGPRNAFKQRDLVPRRYEFAASVRKLVTVFGEPSQILKTRSSSCGASGFRAANYLEAQEASSRKEFFYRINLCRKEAREAGLWLRLLDVGGEVAVGERDRLLAEANELKLIFAAIAAKDDDT